MTDPDITKLRASIDALDDKLIDLLNERCGFVKQVGMTKKKRQQEGLCFIRSGREAEMVRRIYAKFKDGAFPAVAATHIWRVIINASLSLESTLTVSAFAGDAAAEAYWLAREYFGAFTPIAKQPTSKRVLGDVSDGKAEVGVLPLPDDTSNGSWWPRLPEGIKIFACIPFMLPEGMDVKAIAVAKLEPEPTGNDVSFVRIETDMDVSQSRLKSLFDKHKLATRWLAVETFPSGRRAHLIEVAGFLTGADTALQAMKAEAGASVLAITVLGAYALPLAV